MRIVGIDPGLKATGYGFIEIHNQSIKLLETGTIEPNKKEIFPNRIEKVFCILASLIDQYQPDVLVLEKLYAHTTHPVTASILGHVRGVICLLCAQKKLKLIEYSVKRIRKAVTGNGNASKLQTQHVVLHLLNIGKQKMALDASDALALAVGYTRIHNCVFASQLSKRIIDDVGTVPISSYKFRKIGTTSEARKQSSQDRHVSFGDSR